MLHYWGRICMQMAVLPVLYLLGPGWDFLIPDVWPLHSSGSFSPLTVAYHLEIEVITAGLWPLYVCSVRPVFTKAAADIVLFEKYEQVPSSFRNLHVDALNIQLQNKSFRKGRKRPITYYHYMWSGFHYYSFWLIDSDSSDRKIIKCLFNQVSQAGILFSYINYCYAHISVFKQWFPPWGQDSSRGPKINLRGSQ